MRSQKQTLMTFKTILGIFLITIISLGNISFVQAQTPGGKSLWGSRDAIRQVPLRQGVAPEYMERKVVRSDGSAGDRFGNSLAVSGDTAIIGTCGSNSAYIFIRNGTGWTQQAKLVPTDSESYDGFGCSVAISGETVLVGAYKAGPNYQQGAAYVFVRSGTDWSQQAILRHASGAAGDWFGYSVALDGDRAIVGALYFDVGTNINQGVAFLYQRVGTTWNYYKAFSASSETVNEVGKSVAVLGNMVLVGASNSQGIVYVFLYGQRPCEGICTPVITWYEAALLFASDGTAGNGFGSSLAISGNTILVGSPASPIGSNPSQGSAYVFTGGGSTWSEQAKLVASDGAGEDYFGTSVSLLDNTAVAGAPTRFGQGSAYVFTRDGTSWNQKSKLIASDGQPYDSLGRSVALATNAILAGSPYSNSETGSVHSFSPAIGFFIRDGRIVDKYGNDFIMRGINLGHTWATGETPDALANIKATGANTVRISLSTGARWTRNDATDVAGVISSCEQNELVCILEVHDTTGYGDEAGAISLDQAVDYWLDNDIKTALNGHENTIILNIGNEPIGNKLGDVNLWFDATVNAINRLRVAEYKHLIMVDAPNWGGDDLNTMRTRAHEILRVDPQIVFSIHMYGRFSNSAVIEDYLHYYLDNKSPIVIGEFGYIHSSGDADEDAIMSYAQSHGIGYLGWWWSRLPPGDPLDMVVNFDPTNRTWWGKKIISGENGICKTSQEALAFDGLTSPRVCSITGVQPNPTGRNKVDFLVTFSEPVDNLNVSDFVLTPVGLTGAAITNLSGSGQVYTISVSTGTGGGTLRLDLVDKDSVTDSDHHIPLGGVGAGNGDFNFGDPYLVRRMSFSSIGGQDGWILESSETSGLGGVMNGSATMFNLGDDAGDKQYRAILSFFTAGLPDNIIITRAILKIKLQGVVGTNPFGTHTDLKVDIRRPYFGTTIGLLPGDFQASPSYSNVGTFLTPASGWYTAVIAISGYPAFNVRDTTQFKLYFSRDDNDDNGADYLKFFSGDYPNLVANLRPTLVVDFFEPDPTALQPEIEVRYLPNDAVVPDGSTTPSTTNGTDFGSTGVSSGAVIREFRIWNYGSGSLELLGNPRVVIGGNNPGDFRVSLQPTSPIGGGRNSTQFRVLFDPTSSGVKFAVINILSNDLDESLYNFTIKGTGTFGNSVGFQDFILKLWLNAIAPLLRLLPAIH